MAAHNRVVYPPRREEQPIDISTYRWMAAQNMVVYPPRREGQEVDI
jgi:hypothetical protein